MKYDMICEKKVKYETKMDKPETVYVLLKDFLKLSTRAKEHFVVITLDGSHVPISVRTISVGLVNRTMVHPREVFRPAIIDNAVAIMLVHNHPSGALDVSREDLEITKRLKLAGELLGIPVLDHVIISSKGFYSMLGNGVL